MIELALLICVTSPNPCVTCRIESLSQLVIGQTQPRGGPHAEIMALRAAAAQGVDVRGAMVHVSLEPCAHHGRTPPCTSALIAAGVGKVVIAILDPNPLVAGKGVQQLRDAGIEVEVLPTDHPDAIASRELNIGFFSRMIRRVPWVRMKVASSLDGVTALSNGQSQWITGEAARNDGQAWRARSCAVLTGIGTVLADDPQLNVRALLDSPEGRIAAPRQPHFVLVDSQLDIPLDAKLLKTIGQRGAASAAYAQETIDLIAPRAGFIYHASQNDEKIKALEVLGAKLIYMPEASSGKVDLKAMMSDLAVNQEINELHVEAGFKLNGSLLKAGLVDELLVYLAPKLLGAGMGLANLPELSGLSALPAAQDLVYQSVDLVGEEGSKDLRIVARVRGRDTF
ncbi:bifunctional diaminohydroxyphosphoribosylaminopyrimidine deaminase/5-amino-6-(5-phosphoribosylamino)uracil reductase RibD [Variovorax sp. PCZ-1]|uniref:bifunctional diaminohydroxyphosphoribosylaminopyrimidine deaminase/5-amino-6-(5-phosphoribosylamino)uracil reductase RibD n=1 Tax=Variovorax sp. PCZ-1 TaxID=2835533 RepID=UPI001BCD623C|nr:bifunctional diaminohydroxyphosphoribosylaminopyrimidine deaminase/5-amino-6-(5-phosphoribosylamino)uracil reductase RibD [Variovorax sp. PCZ-1]MBS7807517.1 bifunctional diaminohydroxyphosphoribosylaminopyrimidine deaminase/5-amino-6-(5-phosphoribosylamino)uracil reductase RibD [Variovorax sp. PCZ-1]